MLYQVVTRGVREQLDEDRYSSELRGIVDELLNKKPERRPSMAQLRDELLLARHNQQLQASRSAHLHVRRCEHRRRARRRRAVPPPPRPPPADAASAARVEAVDEALTLRVPTDGLAALWRQAGTPADRATRRWRSCARRSSRSARRKRRRRCAAGWWPSVRGGERRGAASGGGRRGDVSRLTSAARAVVGGPRAPAADWDRGTAKGADRRARGLRRVATERRAQLAALQDEPPPDRLATGDSGKSEGEGDGRRSGRALGPSGGARVGPEGGRPQEGARGARPGRRGSRTCRPRQALAAEAAEGDGALSMDVVVRVEARAAKLRDERDARGERASRRSPSSPSASARTTLNARGDGGGRRLAQGRAVEPRGGGGGDDARVRQAVRARGTRGHVKKLGATASHRQQRWIASSRASRARARSRRPPPEECGARRRRRTVAAAVAAADAAAALGGRLHGDQQPVKRLRSQIDEYGRRTSSRSCASATRC